jgi:hypothetical protein
MDVKNNARFWVSCLAMGFVVASCIEGAADALAEQPAAEAEEVALDYFEGTWTMKRWKYFPPQAKKEDHMLEGDQFEIVAVDGRLEVRPLGALRDRWDVDARPLERYGDVLCTTVELRHGFGRKTHLLAFSQDWEWGSRRIPKRRLDVRFEHRGRNLECEQISIHGGVAHAEN